MTAPVGSASTRAPLGATVERLIRASREQATDPYTAIEWPESVEPSSDWFSTPELSSLYGTERWAALDEADRKRLAFYEAVNFFSLNIHGESILMQGLAARLYRTDFLAVSDYLHHFLDEENKHSVVFGGFCRRYARVYPSRHVQMADATERSEADFLFFARVLVFEEIVDRYNVAQARDERLHPLARWINHMHHADEARHLIFGRQLVRELWQQGDWDAAARARVSAGLGQFVDATWREYYNPQVYGDAGLADPWDVAHEAWAMDAQVAHRERMSARSLGFLREVGVLDAP